MDIRSMLEKSSAGVTGEKLALQRMQEEAAKHGATLKDDGVGGLSSSLVLGVMRRDGYRCKKCGGMEQLSVHHKGGLEHPVSRWLKMKAHSNQPNNLATICNKCHDQIHDADRASDKTSQEVDLDADGGRDWQHGRK